MLSINKIYSNRISPNLKQNNAPISPACTPKEIVKMPASIYKTYFGSQLSFKGIGEFGYHSDDEFGPLNGEWWKFEDDSQATGNAWWEKFADEILDPYEEDSESGENNIKIAKKLLAYIAESCFDPATTDDETKEIISNNLRYGGNGAYNIGNYKLAIDFYLKAREIAPNNVNNMFEAACNLSDSYYELEPVDTNKVIQYSTEALGILSDEAKKEKIDMRLYNIYSTAEIHTERLNKMYKNLKDGTDGPPIMG